MILSITKENYPSPWALNLSLSKLCCYEYVFLSQDSTKGVPFEVLQCWNPNSAYVVLRTNGNETAKLYLSSDAAGKMKLKASEDEHTPEIEPALLFRVVKPQKLPQ